MNRPDKQQRKDALDRWKAQQRAEARAKLPLPDDQMQAMFDMLRAELPKQVCDHTLRLVRSWLSAHGLSEEATEKWLHANACNCDCEALTNAERAWQDAIYDVDWD
jgi:hypothetical protein